MKKKESVVQNAVKVALILGMIITSFYCAGQQAPPGGPLDTTPPKIIETYPKAGTLRYHDNKIAFSFSKYVDRRSLQESFFISPAIGELTFDWDGTDVEISFEDLLRLNTTYIVTIGTDVVDTRRNRLTESFSLPFSTGEAIDSCSIVGIVVDSKPVGVMIFAYQLDHRDADTLNPSKVKPDFLTQTGKDGTFLLPYLPYGTFRLIAVRDEYKNLVYDVQVDQYGITNSDFTLAPKSSTITGVQFRLTREDTTAPFLSSARSIDKSHILLRFNKEMDISSTMLDSISVFDTLSKKSLKVLDISFGEPPLNEAQLVSEQQDSGKTYLVQLHGFKDTYGNQMHPPTNNGDFTASNIPDTTKATFVIKEPLSNAKDVAIDDSIHFVFSEAINKQSFQNGFSLKDSLSKMVDGTFSWHQSREVFFCPNWSFELGMRYKIGIKLDSIIGFDGMRNRDSVVTYRFTTVEEKSLSSISGTIIDSSKDAKGKIYITASNIAKKESKPRTICIDSVGQFKFDRLYEGRYTLSAFRDTDTNSVYTFGKPFPYQSAERFVVYPDTLKLRARWPLEGVTIRLK